MGGLYRPSNGTEGDIFESHFCERCTRDNLEPDGGGGCELILLAMCFYTDDPNYPQEWTYDDAGKPTCTAFEERAL